MHDYSKKITVPGLKSWNRFYSEILVSARNINWVFLRYLAGHWPHWVTKRGQYKCSLPWHFTTSYCADLLRIFVRNKRASHKYLKYSLNRDPNPKISEGKENIWKYSNCNFFANECRYWGDSRGDRTDSKSDQHVWGSRSLEFVYTNGRRNQSDCILWQI